LKLLSGLDSVVVDALSMSVPCHFAIVMGLEKRDERLEEVCEKLKN